MVSMRTSGVRRVSWCIGLGVGSTADRFGALSIGTGNVMQVDMDVGKVNDLERSFTTGSRPPTSRLWCWKRHRPFLNIGERTKPNNRAAEELRRSRP